MISLHHNYLLLNIYVFMEVIQIMKHALFQTNSQMKMNFKRRVEFCTHGQFITFFKHDFKSCVFVEEDKALEYNVYGCCCYTKCDQVVINLNPAVAAISLRVYYHSLSIFGGQIHIKKLCGGLSRYDFLA